MSGAQSDPWAAFPVVQDDPWSAFPVVQEPQQAQPGGVGAYVDNLVRQAARGVTLGFADELAAGANATVGAITGAPGTWRERYDAGLAQERARDARFQQENPVAAGAAQVAGAVATPMGAVTRFAAGAPTIGGAMLRGAGVGSGLGGVAGFGDAEGGLGNRLGGAATGAAVGGAVGAALPPVLSGAAALGARMTGGAGPQTQARRLILRDLERDGITPQDLAARSRAAGDAPAMLADLGGENVQGAAQAITRLPGPARQMGAEAVRGRGGEAQVDRLSAEVRRSVNGADFRQTADALIEQQQQRARPAYERAFSESGPVDVAPILANLDTRISEAKGGIRSALERARSLLLDQSGNPDTRIAALHQAKLAIDDMLSGGAETPIGRVARRELVDVQKQLVASMDQASTVNGESLYRAARQEFAGPAGVMDAMATGRNLLNGTQDAFEKTAAEIREMSAAEREGLRVGLARGLLDRIERATDAQELTRLNQIAGSRALRERVRAAFDNEAEFNGFMEALQREGRMAQTNRLLDPRGGSPTMSLQERAADLANPPRGPVAQSIMSAEGAQGGDLAPLARDLVQAGTGGGLTGPVFRGIQRFGQASDARARERYTGQMAPMLFNTDPNARQQTAEALVAQALRDAQIRRAARPIVGGLLQGSAVGGGLLDLPYGP